MKNGHFNENWRSDDDTPMGGVSCGRGFTISWQNGALGQGNERKEPNGAFVEDVIDAVIRRLQEFQSSRFRGDENRRALESLRVALNHLNDRTKRRSSEGVEGTHKT